MQRYSPLLVSRHWLMALLILVALAAGGLLLANLLHVSLETVAGLGPHITFGPAPGAGLFPVVHDGTSETLPAALAGVPTRIAQSVIASILVALIALHSTAALHHQIILTDEFLRRS